MTGLVVSLPDRASIARHKSVVRHRFVYEAPSRRIDRRLTAITRLWPVRYRIGKRVASAVRAFETRPGNPTRQGVRRAYFISRPLGQSRYARHAASSGKPAGTPLPLLRKNRAANACIVREATGRQHYTPCARRSRLPDLFHTRQPLITSPSVTNAHGRPEPNCRPFAPARTRYRRAASAFGTGASVGPLHLAKNCSHIPIKTHRGAGSTKRSVRLAQAVRDVDRLHTKSRAATTG